MTHLDPNSMICGLPALKVRGLLRLGVEPYSIDADLIAREMKINTGQARRLLTALEAAGYLERNSDPAVGWITTTRGIRLAIANASPQIKRTTADRLLGGLVERMHELLAHPTYTIRVAEAWVFGSYVTGAGRLSDVDVLIRFEGRFGDKDRDQQLRMTRIREVAKHRRWRNITEEYSWPHTEVLRFLRARSPYLELHDLAEEPQLSRTPGIRRIFPVRDL